MRVWADVVASDGVAQASKEAGRMRDCFAKLGPADLGVVSAILQGRERQVQEMEGGGGEGGKATVYCPTRTHAQAK